MLATVVRRIVGDGCVYIHIWWHRPVTCATPLTPHAILSREQCFMCRCPRYCRLLPRRSTGLIRRCLVEATCARAANQCQVWMWRGL